VSINRHPSTHITGVTSVIVVWQPVRPAAGNGNDKYAVTSRGKSERMP